MRDTKQAGAEHRKALLMYREAKLHWQNKGADLKNLERTGGSILS
jgi:hypothetical protein